jgi:hypothetical protein
MTITTTAVEVTYTADGIAVAFAVPFAFIANSHVLVYKNSVLQTSGYTLTGANTPSGGTIVFDIAPGAGAIIYLRRSTPLLQDIDVVNNASVFASTLEVGLDYAAARQQETAFEVASLGEASASNYVPCTITVVGSYWLFVPKPGFSVVALGVDQVFFGVAPADSPASLGVKVNGINNTPGDERLVKAADGTTTISTGDVLEDGLVAIYYHSVGSRAGLFQLVSGEIITGGGAGALFTKMTQTARTNNTVTLAPATGYVLPNNTGDGFLMAWEVPADGVADLSWLFNITGINGVDSYSVKYRDGTALPSTTPKAGDWLFFNRPGATGAYFTIQDHWKAGTAQGSTDGGLSLYEQAGAQGAAQRAASADRIARKKLNIADPTFTGVLSTGDATWQGTDPAFVHARTIASAAASPHAFSDSAALSFAGGLAYNSFEARFQVTGTGNYDHFAGFQANFDIATSGTTTHVWAYFSAPIIDTGTATNAYGFEVMSFRGTGTITNAYGLLIRTLDRGTNRWAIKQEGVSDLNIFAGRMDVENFFRVTSNTTVPSTGAGLELNYNAAFNAGQGAANLLAYDRGGAAYKPLLVDGLYVSFRTASVARFTVTDTTCLVVSGALGYGTGTGGTVTQATSKSTGVTLNKSCGRITMNAANLAAGVAVSFTLTNSVIAADDVVVTCIKSGATAGAYLLEVDAVGAGSCQISLRNHSGGPLAEAVVLNFAVIKSVAA